MTNAINTMFYKYIKTTDYLNKPINCLYRSVLVVTYVAGINRFVCICGDVSSMSEAY